MPAARMMCFIVLMVFALNIHAQDSLRVLSAKAISNLLPTKIKGLSGASDTHAKLITLGTLHYSMAEKKYTTFKKELRLMLFDYVDAPVMYNQAQKNWNSFHSVANDSISQQSITSNYYSGWETSMLKQQTSQIVLAIFGRYILIVDSKNIDTETLHGILVGLNLDKYPH